MRLILHQPETALPLRLNTPAIPQGYPLLLCADVLP